jgi:hypothetical protein
MATVGGVDFGTLDVPVSMVAGERALLDAGVVESPLHREREDSEIRDAIAG